MDGEIKQRESIKENENAKKNNYIQKEAAENS